MTNEQMRTTPRQPHMSRRDFLRTSAVVASGTLLAGCVLPGTAPEAGTGAAPAGEVAELTLWMFSMNPELIDYISEQVNVEFQDAFSGSVTLTPEHVPYDGYRQKLTTSIAGNALPDIHEAGTQAAGRVATSGEGIPLDDYMETWDDLDDYFEANIRGTQIAGRTWGVPIMSQPSLTLYWKSAFEEAGLDPESPPVNDVEYLEAAVQLHKVDDGRIVQLGGWSPTNWRGFFQAFEVQLQRLGGEMADEDYTEVRFNTPEGEAALGWIVELFQTMYPEGVARLPEEAPIPHFANRNIALHMRAHGNNPRDVLEYNPDFFEDLGYAYPLEAKEGTGRKNSISWRNFLSVAPTSIDPAAATEFCHIFSNPIHNVFYSQWGGYIPVRKSTIESDFVKNSEFVGNYLEMAAPHGYDVINPPGYFELRQSGGNFFEEAALGKISVAEALQQCADIWQEGLDNAPSYKIPDA